MRILRYVVIGFLLSLGAAHAGPWPTDNIVTTNLDNPLDSPSAARADIYNALLRTKEIIGARSSVNGVAPLDASGLVPLVNLPSTLVQTSGDQTVAGVKTFTSYPVISGGTAGIKLNDTSAGEDDFWIYAASNTLYLLTDRDDDGAWETPHPLYLSNSAAGGQLYGATIWTTANDGTDSGLAADTVDGYHAGNGASNVLVLDAGGLVPLADIPTSFARVDAATNFTTAPTISGNEIQTVPAAETGYTYVGGGTYSKNSISGVNLVYNTLTAIAAPAGAKSLILELDFSVYTDNAIGARGVTVYAYSDTGTTVAKTRAHYLRETVAAGSLLTLGFHSAYVEVPVVSGNAYIKYALRTGANSMVDYRVVGYKI